MKTPKEKYYHDPHYRAFVDTLVSYIHQAKYTPSEVREAAILACIIYEENNIHKHLIKDFSRVDLVLKELETWLEKNITTNKE